MSHEFSDLINLVPAVPAVSAVPAAGEPGVDWDAVMKSGLAPCLRRMAETGQNPKWHGEGDVWTHTKLVCESLIQNPAWRELEKTHREELFVAALLHDIGKPSCTREEGGLIVSPNHASVGDRMARTILWRDFGLCGTPDAQCFRETVCSLIRFHIKPFYVIDEKTPERTAITFAAQGELVPHFTNELLLILAEADMRGRVAEDLADNPERLNFFRELSEEAGCLRQPKTFPSAFSRYAYLSGRNVFPGQDLYDDTWGTVVLLSGLPGTGKDTYIKEVYPDMHVVSLDAFRKEMKVSPTDSQGEVVRAATEQAKVYLRNHQAFVWNATNVSIKHRERLIRLFMGYKAKVKIVFLETSWDEMLRRNQSRKAVVPESAIEKMLEKMAPPSLCEAHEVEWILR